MNNNKKITSLALAFSIIALAISIYSITNSSGSVDLEAFNAKVEEGIDAYAKKQQANQPTPSAPAPTAVVEGDLSDDDAFLGDADAPVTVVEFSDYECPFCKRNFTNSVSQIMEKYVETGKVKYVFRDFPLGFHDPLATQQAMAAECARELGDDETYFAYHDLIFETTNSNGKGMQKSQLYDLAEQVGVNKAKFTECLDSEKYADEVKKDIADGKSVGVSGTPATFVNGKFISGAQPFSVFEAAIEAELAK